MATSDQSRPRLVGVEWVATRVGIAEARAYMLAREGILPCIRIGRIVRFDPEQVEDFISGGGASWDHGWRKEKPE